MYKKFIKVHAHPLARALVYLYAHVDIKSIAYYIGLHRYLFCYKSCYISYVLKHCLYVQELYSLVTIFECVQISCRSKLI